HERLEASDRRFDRADVTAERQRHLVRALLRLARERAAREDADHLAITLERGARIAKERERHLAERRVREHFDVAAAEEPIRLARRRAREPIARRSIEQAQVVG